jgi:hypothetical protein
VPGDSGWIQGRLRVNSGSAPDGFRATPGEFRIGSGWFPGRLRMVSTFRATPGRFRVNSGSASGGFRVGSGWFPGDSG